MTDEDFEVINGVRIPSGFLLLEPREHLDAAICGIEDRVLYDESKLIDAYIDSGMTYEESLEWISYNSDIDGVFLWWHKGISSSTNQKRRGQL